MDTQELIEVTLKLTNPLFWVANKDGTYSRLVNDSADKVTTVLKDGKQHLSPKDFETVALQSVSLIELGGEFIQTRDKSTTPIIKGTRTERAVLSLLRTGNVFDRESSTMKNIIRRLNDLIYNPFVEKVDSGKGIWYARVCNISEPVVVNAVQRGEEHWLLLALYINGKIVNEVEIDISFVGMRSPAQQKNRPNQKTGNGKRQDTFTRKPAPQSRPIHTNTDFPSGNYTKPSRNKQHRDKKHYDRADKWN